MLHLPRPLFWLKYCTKDIRQNFKTSSSISSQTGCPYDPLSGRLSNLGLPYQEAQSHTAMAVSLLASLGFTVNLEKSNLVPRAHVPFGQHQDTELWNNQLARSQSPRVFFF